MNIIKCLCSWLLYIYWFITISIHCNRGEYIVTSCPDDCLCNNDQPNSSASCNFGNSTFNITTTLWNRTLLSNIDCNGTTFTSDCVNLPQILTTWKGHAKVYVTSCYWEITECFDDIYKNIDIITRLTVQNMLVDNIDNIILSDILKPIKELQAITTDDTENVPFYVINVMGHIDNFEFVGGKVNASYYRHAYNINDSVNLTLRNNDIISLRFRGLGIAVVNNLDTISIINSNIERITANTFNGLSVLQALILRDNSKLKSIEVKALSKLKNLKYLHIKGSALESLPNGLFNGLPRLREVIIEKNINGIDLGSELFSNLLTIETMKITESKINNLPEDMFDKAQHLTHINLADNIIKTIPESLFMGVSFLRDVILKTNKIIMVPELAFVAARNLKYVDLRDNYIVEFSGYRFFPNMNSIELLLDDNKLTILKLNELTSKRFFHLSVSSNRIRRIISSKVGLSRIKYLNLSNNKLSSFDLRGLDLRTLQKLNLSGNNIERIHASLMYIPHQIHTLEIDLRSNNITDIIIDKSLTELSNKSLTKTRIYLSKNSLNCDCNVTRLLKDMRQRGILVDYDDVICKNLKEYISNTYIHAVCDDKFNVIRTIGTCAVPGLAVLILISSLCAQRDKLKNYVKNIMNRETNDLTEQQIRQDEYKKFDVFVSFAHQDDEFVKETLLPKLEIQFGQSVCIHNRDWIVGELIADQIIESVESSRKTIILLTESFISSEWSMLEFQTAYSRSKQGRTSNVIIIAPDKAIVTNPQLPDDIRSCIIKYGYLRIEDSNFWTELRNVLPKRGKKSKKHVK